MTTECTEPKKARTLETLPERTKARAHTVAICLQVLFPLPHERQYLGKLAMERLLELDDETFRKGVETSMVILPVDFDEDPS